MLYTSTIVVYSWTIPLFTSMLEGSAEKDLCMKIYSIPFQLWTPWQDFFSFSSCHSCVIRCTCYCLHCLTLKLVMKLSALSLASVFFPTIQSQFYKCVLHWRWDSYIRDMILEIWMSSSGITSAISAGLALFQRISGPFAELQIIKSTMGQNLWGHSEDTEQTWGVSLTRGCHPQIQE